MGEINVGAQFGDKYITINGKTSLLSIFCYDNSIDFYFCVVYIVALL